MEVIYLTKKGLIKNVPVAQTRVVDFSSVIDIDEPYFLMGVLEGSALYFPPTGYTPFEMFVARYSRYFDKIQPNHFSELDRQIFFNKEDLILVDSSASSVEPVRSSEQETTEIDPVIEGAESEPSGNSNRVQLRNQLVPFSNQEVTISTNTVLPFVVTTDSEGYIDFTNIMVLDSMLIKLTIDSYFSIDIIVSEAKSKGVLTFLTF